MILYLHTILKKEMLKAPYPDYPNVLPVDKLVDILYSWIAGF